MVLGVQLVVSLLVLGTGTRVPGYPNEYPNCRNLFQILDPKQYFLFAISQNCQSDPESRQTATGKETCMLTNGTATQSTQPNTGWVPLL